MNEWILASACAILIAFTFDFMPTVMSTSGAGWGAKFVSGAVGAAVRAFSRLLGKRRGLELGGMFALTGVLIWWIALLWLGLFVLLGSDTYSVVSSESKAPASFVHKFYVAGYTLSTLGNGDFKPGSGGWSATLAVFSFSGFVFLTAAISYLVAVSEAVIHMRKTAILIDDCLRLVRQTGDADDLFMHASALHENLIEQRQRHLEYPIIRYFFSKQEKSSLSVMLYRLNSALRQVENGEQKLEGARLRAWFMLRRATDQALGVADEDLTARSAEDEQSDSLILPERGTAKDGQRAELLARWLRRDGWYEYAEWPAPREPKAASR